jgi:polar amino acid transport system permease protein
MHFDFSFLLSDNYAALLAGGALTTVRLFASSWVLGLLIALVLVGLRGIALRPLQWVVSLFIEYHRNVPTVVQIMVWYFGMPQVLPHAIRIWVNRGDTEFLFALIALALNVSAYMSQDIISGMRSIPKTQIEAARSIGLSAFSALRYVTLPQALRLAVPPLVNRSLILFKDTSLAMVIGVGELTYETRAIENLTFRTFELFAIATTLYLAASLILMGLGAGFSRRFPANFKG